MGTNTLNVIGKMGAKQVTAFWSQLFDAKSSTDSSIVSHSELTNSSSFNKSF